MKQLIESVRNQIRDTNEPFVFKRETEEAPDEIQNFVQQALIDYSRYKPLKEVPGVLSVEKGKVLYDLPSDFISMDVFPLPFSYRILGQQILLIDVPETQLQIPFIYTAVHSPSSVPMTDTVCIVWFAAALALRAIISDTKKLDSYVSYNLKDVLSVDAKESNKIITLVSTTAQSLESKYEARIVAVSEQSADQPRPAFMSFG